jgi:hypothetical protein
VSLGIHAGLLLDESDVEDSGVKRGMNSKSRLPSVLSDFSSYLTDKMLL